MFSLSQDINFSKYFSVINLYLLIIRTSNTRIKQVMKEWRIDGDFKKLEAIFMEKLLDDLRSLNIPKGHICK